MQHLILKRLTIAASSLTAIAALTVVPVSAISGNPAGSGRNGDTSGRPISAPASGQAPASNSGSGSNSDDKVKEDNIKQRGDNEISRRLTSLNDLITKINAATKLSASDKSALIAEVNAQIAGLNTLKTTISDDSDLAKTKSDAQSIVTGYRVYAFIFPKVQLIIAADRQQVTEGKLTSLATTLQTALDAAKTSGKDVTALQAQLDELVAKTKAAQTISSSVETSVLPLQPTDFNNDHTILKGYHDQLKTAHADIMTAANDGKAIVNALKS